jgi:hypothetical protein
MDETKTYKKGINEYSDFTDEEFMNYFNLNTPQNECSATDGSNISIQSSLPSSNESPASWDWRLFYGVTPVKN